ncbi:hypothetical protein SAMN05444000_10973 [Shimia gijangensis]|uniref:DUF6868 domain-containing protein n=1 Tax=Shimia gijangensis TaxID=1470563 RepID=A0A1M6JNJ8_9RHOB|nr:hypothetical protein [Shimia gijangensis]SHJ48277.1 hypothetical protein SAMN05444000_10973 [Shimia gijangensis]
MTYEILTAFFGWMTVINFALLAVSGIAVLAMRDWITSIHMRMFKMDEKDVHNAYFNYLAQYKVATIVLSLAPYLALRFAG